MKFYQEELKKNKTIIRIDMMKTDDGRHWVSLESIFVGIAKLDVESIPKYIKHIPKPYLKSVRKKDDEPKKKYIDRTALGMISSQIDNYDLFKFSVARTNNKLDKYFPMLLVESMTSINNKLNNLTFLRNELSNADKSRNDLLHDNEKYCDLTDKEKSEFYDDLNKLQEERRKLKVQIDFYTSFKNFFEKHGIKSSEIKDLFNHINGVNVMATKKIYKKRATKIEETKYIKSISN